MYYARGAPSGTSRGCTMVSPVWLLLVGGLVHDVALEAYCRLDLHMGGPRALRQGKIIQHSMLQSNPWMIGSSVPGYKALAEEDTQKRIHRVQKKNRL